MPVTRIAFVPNRVLRRFRRAKGGISTVEFALIAPFLFVLFCGSIELSRMVTASNRATFVAETVAQLVSQVNEPLTVEQVSAFMAASVLIDPDILTYQRQRNVSAEDATNINVSSVAFVQKVPSCRENCEYNAAVVFSQRNNRTGPVRACGTLQQVADTEAPSAATLPASVYGPVSLVVVDIEIFVKPLFTFLYNNDVKFRRSAYFRPRLVERVNSVLNCPGYPVT